MGMNIVNKIFTEAYNSSLIEVPFNPEWNNGTGYYDSLVNINFNHRPGTVLKSLSDNGRRILIVVTRFGNVIVFDRYSVKNNDWEKQEIFVSNTPRSTIIRELIPSGCLGERAMVIALGEYRNVGKLIEDMSMEFAA